MNSQFECNFTCLIFKSGHKNILEPETSRLCARVAPSHIHLLLKRATVESLTAGK